MPLVTVEPTRLYRQIAEQIEALVASGEFARGRRLPSERDLSSMLGVSRTSVREAIIALEMSGLVEVRVGTGIFVTEDTAKRPAKAAPARSADGGLSPFELLAARGVIEGEIAAQAAPLTRRADVAALEATLATMRDQGDKPVMRDGADREFHLTIAGITRNSALMWIVGALWDQRRSEIFKRLESRFHTPALRERTLEDHKAVIDALAARDAEGARAAMQRHIARVMREFKRHWEGDSAQKATRTPYRSSRRERGSSATRRQT